MWKEIFIYSITQWVMDLFTCPMSIKLIKLLIVGKVESQTENFGKSSFIHFSVPLTKHNFMIAKLQKIQPVPMNPM